jgi:hypothetical protein
LLGEGDGFAASLVEDAEIAEERGRVSAAYTYLFFHQFEVGADKSQVEHA